MLDTLYLLKVNFIGYEVNKLDGPLNDMYV